MTRRSQRIGELIQEEVSDLLRRQVKDPRLGGFITVTKVDVSADLKQARVFVSIMGTDEEKRQAMQGFQAALGFLRHELAARLQLRFFPELTFHRDDTIEEASHVLQLIKEVSPTPQEQE